MPTFAAATPAPPPCYTSPLQRPPLGPRRPHRRPPHRQLVGALAHHTDDLISSALHAYPTDGPLPPLTPEQLHTADRAFERRAYRAPYGVRVRHVQLLCGPALDVFATIWQRIESQFTRAVVPLLHKKTDCGLRPIGPLPALYRVALTCRRPGLGAVEERTRRP